MRRFFVWLSPIFSILFRVFVLGSMGMSFFDHVHPNLEYSELHVATSFRNSTQLVARSRSSLCGLILWASCLVILLYLSREKKNPSQTVVIYYVLWPTVLTE